MMSNEAVLIVEDNARNMKLFRDLLQVHGYRTFEATSGEDAVELAAVELPALVLMDIQLPGIDGIQALEQLRGAAATAGIPVLAVTAQAMHGDRERLREVGFDDYLAKPVDIHELLHLVERYCRPIT